MSERKVGFAPGVTEYTEVIVRTVYPDGTSSDSEPERARPEVESFADLARMFSKVADAKRGVSVQRLTRPVRIEVGEWQLTPPAAPEQERARFVGTLVESVRQGDLLTLDSEGKVSSAGESTGPASVRGRAAVNMASGTRVEQDQFGVWIPYGEADGA